MKRDIYFIRLSSISFPVMDKLLTNLVDMRTRDEIPDLLFALSYQTCLSIGSKSLNHDDLLKPLDYFEDQGIFLHKAIRGGGLTYYWPEQLLFYPLIKLQKNERNIPGYMYNLEETGLRTLQDFGVSAERKREQTAQIGLWVGDNKIASTGIRVSRWVTSYGMALNVGGDPGPSQYIRPCGLEGVKLVTIPDITQNNPGPEQVVERFTSHFQEVFDRNVLNYENYGPLYKTISPLMANMNN